MREIDLSIVRAIAKGEESAYAQVIERLYQPVYRFAFRLCHDSATAEDITQETFLAIWQGIDSFKGKSRFSSWVFGIAYRQFRSVRRKRTVQTIPLDEQEYRDDTSDLCEQMELADLQARVHKALDTLQDIHRQVVFLIYTQGLTYSEAAYVLDLPIGTVKSRMNYALNILREEIGGEEVSQHEMRQPKSLS